MNCAYRALGIGALVIGTVGCKNSTPSTTTQTPMVAPQVALPMHKSCEFTTFGEYALPRHVDYRSALPVAAADLDNDGDVDVVLGVTTSRGSSYFLLCENKMPQKNGDK